MAFGPSWFFVAAWVKNFLASWSENHAHALGNLSMRLPMMLNVSVVAVHISHDSEKGIILRHVLKPMELAKPRNGCPWC